MFRTRDFILLFVTIVFLVLAIGVTLWQQQSDELAAAPSQVVTDLTEKTYTAEVVSTGEPPREQYLADMQRKIAAGATIATPESMDVIKEYVEVTAEEDSTAPTSTDVSLTDETPESCANYALYQGVWPQTGVLMMEAEGVRVVYVEESVGATAGAVAPLSATTTANRTVLLRLPLYPNQLGTPTCVATDVIGVAKDGSLIRNTEAGMYGVFGSDTLIGYALDGFPIYGVSDQSLDICGGVTVASSYRYYLKSGASRILHCFRGNPSQL